MARNLLWLLGGSSTAAALGVAGYVVTQLPEGGGADAPQAPLTMPAPLAAPQTPDARPEELDRAPAPVAQDPAREQDPDVETALAQPGLAFDVVRVARDGNALVAGQSDPGAPITLRVDGEVVAEVHADEAGQFVALFDLGYSDALQMMTLETTLEDGTVERAPDRVILTPRFDPNADAAPQAAVVADEPAQVPEHAPVIIAPATTEPEVAAAEAGAPESVAPGNTAPEIAMVEVAPLETSAEPAPETQGAPDPVWPPESDPEADPEPGDMPTALLLREGGEVALLDRAPQVMDNVLIDTISYSAQGDVQISGRAAGASPEANVRIYLDNAPIAVTAARAGDWRLDLPNVDPGVYTLRVDQIDTSGQVVSRFETPFQREDPEVVLAVRQAAQESESGQQPLSEQISPDQPGSTNADAVPLPQEVANEGVQAPEIATRAEGQNAAPVHVPADSGQADSPAIPAPPVETPSLITVQPGHTLWAISTERYGAGELYVQIYRANRAQIRNPNLIYPGQIFALPATE